MARRSGLFKWLNTAASGHGGDFGPEKSFGEWGYILIPTIGILGALLILVLYKNWVCLWPILKALMF